MLLLIVQHGLLMASMLLGVTSALDDILKTAVHESTFTMCVDHYFAIKLSGWEVRARAEDPSQNARRFGDCGNHPQQEVVLADLSRFNTAALSSCEVVVEYKCGGGHMLQHKSGLPTNTDTIQRDGACVFGAGGRQFPSIWYRITVHCRLAGTGSVQEKITKTNANTDAATQKLKEERTRLESELKREQSAVASLEAAVFAHRQASKQHIDVTTEVDLAAS